MHNPGLRKICSFLDIVRSELRNGYEELKIRNMEETRAEINGKRIELVLGDITKEETGAIVNAANTSLLGGGGVDGAIHRAAGPQLLEECRKIGGCPTGEARITKGHALKAQYVIHTVGPVYSGREKDSKLLESAYSNSLKLAIEHEVQSISFPAISTGVYRYPVKEAAQIAISTSSKYLKEENSLNLIRLVLFSEPSLRIYREEFKKLLK